MKWRGTRAELKAALRRIPAVLSGREPDRVGIHSLFWGIVGNGALDIIRADFKTKLEGGTGQFDGIKWAKLAAATIAKRRRENRGDDNILYESGQLISSLLSGFEDEPNGFAPDQIFRVLAGGIEVGTADRTADRHQKGTDVMPARPVVPDGPVPPAWELELEKVCVRALVKVVERVVEVGPK